MASLSPDSILLEDFGQKVDLTRRIREVLLNYPEGTTVLKELIQNADDASATKVRLCLDRRIHATQTLLSPSLSQWQGPALLAFNDAVFTEEDFVSISRIGGSAKHGQAWKTGRFGVGFNSVYHLTDLPSFVSGNYVVLFDPQGDYLPNVSAMNPGKRIDFVSSAAVSIYNDQFSPYCAFGCDMRNPFSGTLFRFPLRNSDQAGTSKLSRQAYSDEDVLSLFGQIYEECVLSLLFLKSVLSVEMYVWDAGEAQPKKLYSCSVSSVNDEVIWHRKALLRMTKNLQKSRSQSSSGYVDGEMDSYSVEFLSEEVSEGEVKKRTDVFQIVQAMASSNSRIASFASAASKEYDIHLLPWASVAACISDNDDLKLGRAFCFLPLPVRTGLSVQVNGYFEVSSNRRGIWYGDDMDRSGKIRSVWNKFLLEDIVAPTFRCLVLGVQEFLGASDLYYSLFPVGSFEEPWSILVENIYRVISDAPLLHSGLEGVKWVTPRDAFLHDGEFSKSKELGEALLMLGMPIVHLPSNLLNMFLKYASGFQQKVVTPDTVRHFLKGCRCLQILSKFHRLILLEYCLEDLVDSDVAIYANDMPLLPLANGDFGILCGPSIGTSYFICNDELEHALLKQVSDRLVDPDTPPDIARRLCSIAQLSNTNLTMFKTEYLLMLFPRFVPADWKYKEKVAWNSDSMHILPTSSWFKLFWQYLRSRCEKLSMFGDWPIFPSSSGYLYKPSRESKLLATDNLPGLVQGSLIKLGCKILDSSYGVEHPDLSQYVSDADCVGVVESIFNVFSSNSGLIERSFQNLLVEERDELRGFLLDPKWYMGGFIDETIIRTCKRLPVFRVYGGTSTQDVQFSDLGNPQKYLPPLDVPTNFLGVQFIMCSTATEEHILLRFFGIERIKKSQFYKQHVFSSMKDLQPEVRDFVMLSILQNLPQLCVEDTTFKECLRNLEFVPTLNGAIRSPVVLYDPRNEELVALLEDSDSFPCGNFLDPDILDMLHSLGLKTSVSPETVIESARQIEALMHKDQQKAQSRGKLLLSYLEVNAMKWLPNQSNNDQGTVNRIFSRAAIAFRPQNLKSDLEKFWNDLRSISWCPVMVDAPFPTLPWPLVSSLLAPPRLVRPQTDLWMVSATMRILDGECSSTALAYNLGWLSPPGGSAIAAQLLELGKNNEIVNDQVLRQELALAMPKIYILMISLVGSEEMDIIKAILEGSRWIWVGDGFATCDEVVLDGPFHLAPYVRVIPIDLAVFKELFLELGVREYFKPMDFANILTRMANKKGLSPLDTQEIRAAIMIVQHLAEVQFHEQNLKLYLPDVSGRLFPASDLVYNDAPWLLGSDGPDCSFGGASIMALNAKRTVQKFVHGNISNEVAEKLGVCSLRRILLAESADSMNLSLYGAAEAFGQHEALTTRLKHILEMYADGPGILFELVQNAEDAGASEVIFLLDKTQYGTSSVLSPEMSDWQGPALYCFNDSIFTPHDLYAISRIGQESKLEKPFAIGRFGLGFNCVYHFTDIPTFVSGENIVMFDPHANSLPGISPSHPGLRIKYVGKNILEQFPDQFSPFLHFGCDLQHPFPGTLFRFPLRSSNMALRSQIKKEAYVTEDVMSLFTSFSGVVSDALLFLRRVKKISIFVKEGNDSEMQLLHQVHRNFVSEPEMVNAVDDMFSLIDGNRFSGLDKGQTIKMLNKSIDRDFLHKCQKIVVTEQNPSGAMRHFWITSECLGGGRGKKYSALTGGESHKSIPWACVAAYVHYAVVDGQCDVSTAFEKDLFQVSTNPFQSRKSFEGRAFCFLPLPINTGLPAHINSYFELSSNRRDIWFGNDMAGGGKKRSEWNLYILENIAAPAYCHLLEKIASEIGPSDLFFSYWPTGVVLEPWASMVRKIYAFISESGLRVLYTKARGGQWISSKQALFPDFSFHKVHELVEALSDVGLPLVTASKLLVEQFMEVCSSLNLLTPQLLRTLLIRRKRGFHNRSAIVVTLEYCLVDLDPAQPNNLCGLALLPLADGSHTSFEKNGASERIYVTRGEEYGLLKDSLPHLLVDVEIPEIVKQKLCSIAESKKFNVCLLSCDLLEKLFLKLLPTEWQLSKRVTWVPGQQGQPSSEWMRLLWSYLKSSCEDLSIFSKWPILPIQDNSLLRLFPNSNVIEDNGWSENMRSLLVKVGCLFLRRDLPIEHSQLGNFVQPPTAVGILNAFLAITCKVEDVHIIFKDALEGELHELRSFVLQSKWFIEEHMEDIHIELIKQLPMYESYRSRKLVSLTKPTKWLKPNGVREDLFNDDFVRTESEREEIILRRYLDIREPSRVEFYKGYVLNRMPEFLSQQGAISKILHDVKLLVLDDASIRTALSEIPFVLAGNGSWKQPSRLYDPRITKLSNVLHTQEFFPSAEFSHHEMLDILVNLGLRRCLGFSGILDCANTVSLLHDSGDLKAVAYGHKLLGYLDALAHKLVVEDGDSDSNKFQSDILNEKMPGEDTNVGNFDISRIDHSYHTNDPDIEWFLESFSYDKEEEEFWLEIKTISWCPICVDPPIEGLPWLKTNNLVASPVSVRPKSQLWTMSSKMHVLDGECNSMYLQQKLGWLDRLSLNVLSAQLMELSESYNQLKLQSSKRRDFDVALQMGISTLYSRMQEYIGDNDFAVLKSTLHGVPWVWIGDDFVSSTVLAFDSPVKFTPYLYVVPSELTDFRELLLELGVKLSFDIWDYFHVLQRLQKDAKAPLSSDQLSFVYCILEAVADFSSEKPLIEASSTALLIPDSSGFLMCAGDLIYNDAPWIESSVLGGKHFVHPNISNDLANRLGVKSLRCLSLVDEDMTKDLPCMDSKRLSDLLALYGDIDFLLFDLLELADNCKAKTLRLIFDKRTHPCQSLLQHNFGEFQGPALVAELEGVSLNRDEISSLQLLPPWRLRGDTLNYGLGLLGCYSICDVLSIVSGGHFYMFDPSGLVLGTPSSHAPAAKMFSLTGTNLTERFKDQFMPMLIGQDMPWSSSNSTIIRMPLSSECLKDGLDLGMKRVSLSTWDEGKRQPCQDFSVSIDTSSASLRNPFAEKKWRKFQLSRLFTSSNAAIKLNVIDVNLYKGTVKVVDRWLVALSLGSGQTRNMALDRRYLAYNLSPVAGVAALISTNGRPTDINLKGSLLSPLPLSGVLPIPVTVLGCFLVRHNGCRALFKLQNKRAMTQAQSKAEDQLLEAWNRELMSCVRDSYVHMVVEMQKLRRELSSSSLESIALRDVALSLKVYGDAIYSFWPKSNGNQLINQPGDTTNFISAEVLISDWECLIELVVRPFYVQVADLPVWQLYSGGLVKTEEGMFLSLPGNGVGDNVLPATVCGFVKEHYPVFSVPWEVVTEIQAVGVVVREIKPKMVRELLKLSSTLIVLHSVDTYIDVLEYCLSDVKFPEPDSEENDLAMEHGNLTTINSASNGVASSASMPDMQRFDSLSAPGVGSSGDALEMMTSLGRVLFDIGRGVVEDIGRTGGPLVRRDLASDLRGRYSDPKLQQVVVQLRGVPCPTASNQLAKLGSMELWIGSKDQQVLMQPLASKFVHPEVVDRSILSDIFLQCATLALLKLKCFSFQLLASHMKLLFHENWVNHVMGSNSAPWFSWEKTSFSGGEEGPSHEWIRLFWKCYNGSSDELSLFFDWPLVPALLGRPILCRVKERNLVFVPPPLTDEESENQVMDMNYTGNNESAPRTRTTEGNSIEPYIFAFNVTKHKYPWLLSLLNQWNIPVFDATFTDYTSSCYCLPTSSQSLGYVVASKFVAAKHAGYFPAVPTLADLDRDELFTLFASDFVSNGPQYGHEELNMLRSLPIYKTVAGSYTQLLGQDHCMISSTSFLKPSDERCLSSSTVTTGYTLLRALGVPELVDQQILVKFGLPGFEGKPKLEQEDVLIYLYTNWQDLQSDSSLVEILKETKFVRNADEFSVDLSMPRDLFDPSDPLLASVFSSERKKFPGERFGTEGWLRILRKSGIRTANEADVILECARKVESLGHDYQKSTEDYDDFGRDLNYVHDEISAEILTLARSVVEAILSNFAVLYSTNFCNRLGKIACVPAELGFPNIGGKKILTSYSEAILVKDWPLAWSSSPIISRQSVIPPDYSWGVLYLRSPPPFAKVLQHLQVIGRNGGEDTLAHWPTTAGIMTVDEASSQVLKYMDGVWDSLSSAEKKELQSVAFLPVANGTRLVMASSLFARLAVNLSPFAFELPTLFLPFMKVLKELGLQDMLSSAIAKDLLINLQKACGYQRLNPNELRAVMEILSFLCGTSVKASPSDLSALKEDAIIPDDGCRLVHARSCVYIDSYGSRYVNNIDTTRLRFVHPDIPERMCLVLGIRKLSEVVIEELDLEENLQQLESIRSMPLAVIREKLLSRSFLEAVWTIIHNSTVNQTSSTNNLSMESVQSSLQLVAERLRFVKTLHTRFILLPRSLDITLLVKNSIIPEWKDGSKYKSMHYVNQSKSSIFVAEPPVYISVVDVVGIVVSQILGFPESLPLGSLFLCPDGYETMILDILRLSSEKREIEPTTNKLVGKEILPSDALQVQLHPLRPFYKGEMVAWRYHNGEKLRYGRVPEDVRPLAGQALYKLKVETVPSTVEPLLSSQVFSFRSIMMENDVSAANLLENSQATWERSAPKETPESSSGSKPKSSQLQSSKDLQYGRVSAGELVQVVHDMLSTAGINLDAEKQSLLQTTLTLQEQLKESQAALLLEQERAEGASKEAETAKAAWVCRVCLSNEVDITIVPCGHVLCRRCSSAVSRCPFCRLQVTKTIRIFRP
ncbi:SACS [Linum perenne]